MSREALTSLTAGMAIPFGGDGCARVSEALAAAFRPGDRLIVEQETGALLHVRADVHARAAKAVDEAERAFEALQRVGDARIDAFFEAFASRLASPEAWAPIQAANDEDVEKAKRRGRSVTRLVASPKMRAEMIAGLKQWARAGSPDGRVLERVEHEGWSVEQVASPLGVVGFVFEGRPNVFADAAGVIRGRNAAVFRIGSDALQTARAIARHALGPALAEAGLPEGSAVLLDSAEHAAGWALFSDRRLSLAVARGSGEAVAQLGSVARQSGVPVSLHGTGGGWIVAVPDATAATLEAGVFNSLDRKACNTLNVCCIPRARAADLVPAFLSGLRRAGEGRGHGRKLHVAAGDE
ncbi:MAG: aldehyde dehydrogenase family protein, partial [Caulobacteraceae bacterium]